MGTQQKSSITKSKQLDIALQMTEEEAMFLFRLLTKLQKGIQRAKDAEINALKFVESTVASFFKVPIIELYEGKSNRINIYCLSLIFLIMKLEFGMTERELGAIYGVHRTTVIHHVKKMRRMVKTSKEHSEVYNTIVGLIREA